MSFSLCTPGWASWSLAASPQKSRCGHVWWKLVRRQPELAGKVDENALVNGATGEPTCSACRGAHRKTGCRRETGRMCALRPHRRNQLNAQALVDCVLDGLGEDDH